MYYVWFTLLTLVSATCLVGTLLTLPGNWLIVAAAAVFVWLVPDSGLTWLAVGIATGLAILGEFIEAVAGAAGAARLGAKRRSLVLSLVATIAGSIVGSFVVPVPVVGTLVGALIGGAAGAYLGAYAGERSAGTPHELGHQIGGAAMKGRLLGTLAKLVIGVAIFLIVVIDAWA